MIELNGNNGLQLNSLDIHDQSPKTRPIYSRSDSFQDSQEDIQNSYNRRLYTDNLHSMSAFCSDLQKNEVGAFSPAELSDIIPIDD